MLSKFLKLFAADPFVAPQSLADKVAELQEQAEQEHGNAVQQRGSFAITQPLADCCADDGKSAQQHIDEGIAQEIAFRTCTQQQRQQNGGE